MSAKQRRRSRSRSRRRPTALIVGGVVAVVVVAVVLALTLGGSSSKTPVGAADTAAVIRQTTSVPTSVFTEVGQGDAKTLPKPIAGPPLTADGKPQMLYIGAEYCPYCATERWAMVIALSRFGSFNGLSLTHSSSTDVFPNTPTFTFHGSSFSSPYLTFTPVETATNKPSSNGGYQPLDTPTPSEASLLRSLDSSGGIPFVDIGGRYLISGATYDPGVLQGKTAQQIAASLDDPVTAVSKGAVGAANTIVAAICRATNGQPTDVCGSPTVQSIQAQLG